MTYCYRCDQCDWVTDHTCAMSQRPRHMRCPNCGAVMERDFQAEQSGQRSGEHGYPYYSDAMGVHPDQVPELMELDRRNGMNTEYHKDGRVKIESYAMLQRYKKVHGFHHRNSYDY